MFASWPRRRWSSRRAGRLAGWRADEREPKGVCESCRPGENGAANQEKARARHRPQAVENQSPVNGATCPLRASLSGAVRAAPRPRTHLGRVQARFRWSRQINGRQMMQEPSNLHLQGRAHILRAHLRASKTIAQLIIVHANLVRLEQVKRRPGPSLGSAGARPPIIGLLICGLRRWMQNSCPPAASRPAFHKSD